MEKSIRNTINTILAILFTVFFVSMLPTIYIKGKEFGNTIRPHFPEKIKE